MQLVHITLVACKDQTPGLQTECQHATRIKKQQQSPQTERSEDLSGGLYKTATLNNSIFNQYAIKEKKYTALHILVTSTNLNHTVE